MADPQAAYLNRGESLPDYYGEDLLVVLPRDPYNIFAYWEVSLPTWHALEETAGAARWPEASFFLRVYKHVWADESAVESCFDLAVGRDSSSWHIPVTNADRFYQVEWGWKLPGGSFQSILRSNQIRTPRDGFSEVIDEDWQLPHWKERKLFRRISLHHLSSAEFFRHRKNK